MNVRKLACVKELSLTGYKQNDFLLFIKLFFNFTLNQITTYKTTKLTTLGNSATKLENTFLTGFNGRHKLQLY